MKTLIEETYRVIDKHSGKDAGLLVVNINEGHGPSVTDIQLLPLNGWMIEAGDYAVDFVKRLQIEPTTRRRFAPVAMNDRGAA